jgi:MFS transporter, FSR family, fosmidomycin resistance protein
MLREFMKGPMPFLCIGHSFDHMLTLIFATVAAVALQHEWGMSYGDLLDLAWLGFVLFGAGAPLAGWLADRWSGTGMMAVFFVGIGLASVFTGFAGTPVELLIGLSAIGLFASIYHPIGIPMVIEIAGPARGRMLGINGVFGSLGMASAGIVAGAMIDLYTWRMAFIVPGTVCALVGVWFAIRFRHGIEMHKKASGRPDAVIGSAIGRFVRIMALLAVATLGAGLVFQATTVGLPEIVRDRVDGLKDSALGVGTAVTVIMVIGGAAQLAGGMLADRLPLKRAFLLVYGLIVPALLLAAIAFDLPALLLLTLILAITVGNQPIADALFGQYVPARWMSTAFGLRFALSLSSAAIALPLVGRVYDGTGGFFWLFVILAGFAAVAVLAISLLPARAEAAGAEPVAKPARGRIPA